MFLPRADIEAAKLRYRQPPWSVAWEHLLHLESVAVGWPHRVNQTRFNWLLEQTRLNAKYLHSLVVMWLMEPTEARKATIIGLLEDLSNWESWALEGEYDLSTGEIAVCLCGLLDCMSAHLPPTLVTRLEHLIVERVLLPYCNAVIHKQVWWQSTSSNWGAVCHSGAYAAALHLAQHPRSGPVEQIAWLGMENYIAMQTRDGGSSESISYWQYGTRYLTYALLFYHKKHGHLPVMVQQAPLKFGARFYQTFMPLGAPIGFGDCSYAPPEALLLKYCDFVGDTQGRWALEQTLIAYLQGEIQTPKARFLWNQPREAQMLLFLRNVPEPKAKSAPQVVTSFPDTGWYAVHSGDMTASLRCGDNTGAHAMCDQLAMNLAVGGVTLIGYLENHPYTTGWFNRNGEATRQLYFEEQSVSKNTLVINGIGQVRRGLVSAQVADDGVFADATALYPHYVSKASRRIRAMHIGLQLIDNFETSEPCWHELRFFTEGEITVTSPTSVRFSRNGQTCDLIFSCDQEFQIIPALITPSIGLRPHWNMLRVTTGQAGFKTTFQSHIVRTSTQNNNHEIRKDNYPGFGSDHNGKSERRRDIHGVCTGTAQ
ncbi:MAG: heparinase II/III-family protein [Verrucomicrobia bacterium]|nr:heparinase II/III-family protein [Verrucomicrobiota bacterium]